jgi:NAD(P)-dependent dehydrogenase (short-subunit alcohol dehydrogenase family)
VVSAFEHANNNLGPDIDILVNCAGMAPTAPFHKIEFSQWQATMDLNLTVFSLHTAGTAKHARAKVGPDY